MNEMKNLSSINPLMKTIRSSLENLVDDDDPQPVVTFPDPDTPPPVGGDLGSPSKLVDTLKFEQKTVNNFKASKVSITRCLGAFPWCD